jgi:ribosomal-protein-alanine N-acetyltransferase
MLHVNFTPFPTLATDRLVLREIEKEDANEIFILRSDERVNEFVVRPKANSVEDANEFINKIQSGITKNELVMWAITLKNEPKLIGTIVYWNFNKENYKAEIGYELLPAFHGMGIMQEALLKVIEFGFKKMKLKTIEAYIHPNNYKSIKLSVKNNFVIVPPVKSDAGIKEEGVEYLVYSLINKT